MADFAIKQPGPRPEIVVDARVHDLQRTGALPRENVDRRAPCEKIFHHLPRDALRIGRYALVHHAMVCRKHNDGRGTQRDVGRLLDQADLARERFKRAEAAGRLGLVVNRLPEQGREPWLENRCDLWDKHGLF